MKHYKQLNRKNRQNKLYSTFRHFCRASIEVIVISLTRYFNVKYFKFMNYHLFSHPAKFIAVIKSTRQAKKNSASCLRSRPLPLRMTSRTMTPKGQKIPETNAFLGKSSPTTNRQKSWQQMMATRQIVNRSIILVCVSVCAEQCLQNPLMLSSSLLSAATLRLAAEAGTPWPYETAETSSLASLASLAVLVLGLFLLDFIIYKYVPTLVL